MEKKSMLQIYTCVTAIIGDSGACIITIDLDDLRAYGNRKCGEKFLRNLIESIKERFDNDGQSTIDNIYFNDDQLIIVKGYSTPMLSAIASISAGTNTVQGEPAQEQINVVWDTKVNDGLRYHSVLIML
jgi:hypothetical protein